MSEEMIVTPEVQQEKYMLETFDLGIAFGGLRAAQNINLKIKTAVLCYEKVTIGKLIFCKLVISNII